MGVVKAYRWFKLGIELERLGKEFERITAMKLSINAIIQALALCAQGINATTAILPPSAQKWAFIGLSAIQGIVGVLAHFVNIDGTPQALPYRPQP